MHVTTVVVKSFLVVAVEQVLGLDHLPQLLELALVVRADNQGQAYQTSDIPDVYGMRPSTLHQYLRSLVDLGLYVRVGMVGSSACFTKIAKDRRTIVVVVWFFERS